MAVIKKAKTEEKTKFNFNINIDKEYAKQLGINFAVCFLASFIAMSIVINSRFPKPPFYHMRKPSLFETLRPEPAPEPRRMDFNNRPVNYIPQRQMRKPLTPPKFEQPTLTPQTLKSPSNQ